MKTTLTTLVVAAHCLVANAQYKIDSTFNVNGTNEFTLYAGNVVNGEKLAYTSTNDIIVAGRWIDRLSVWKYNQTGALDPSFGSGGMSSIEMPAGVSTWVRDLEIQSDGKIVVLAEAELPSPTFAYSQASIVIARFLPNGDPDSTFHSTGLQNIDLMPAYEYHPYCLATDPAHNIFVGGWGVEYGSYHCPVGTGFWFIAKFQNNGALDNTFNSTGYIQSTSGALAQTYATITPLAQVLDVMPLQGGKLLAAGSLNARDSSYFSLRLNANGEYDSTYAFNGINLTWIDGYTIPPAPASYARILDDQSIIYNAQHVTDGTPGGMPDSTTMYVYKKDDAGNTQTSFGTGGFLTLHQYALRTRMAIDNENRIIYNWYNRLPSGTQTVYFRRLFSNGATDLSFGSGGILSSEPLPGDPYMNECTMNDIQFNPANDDISLVAFRSASYAPTTFRVLNYSLDPDFVSSVQQVNAEKDKLAVYPNPNNGVFTIGVNNISSYKIYTSTGAVIQNGKLNAGKNTVEISVLAKGIYFLEVIDQLGSVSNRKVMVE